MQYDGWSCTRLQLIHCTAKQRANRPLCKSAPARQPPLFVNCSSQRYSDVAPRCLALFPPSLSIPLSALPSHVLPEQFRSHGNCSSGKQTPFLSFPCSANRRAIHLALHRHHGKRKGGRFILGTTSTTRFTSQTCHRLYPAGGHAKFSAFGSQKPAATVCRCIGHV